MTAEEKDVLEEYRSSLEDLTFNSKPLINVLTMLAEENASYGESIVELIANRIKKCNPPVKMPVLYLLDSILKNVGDAYRNIVAKKILSIFLNVFETADEKSRLALFKLRNTWPPCFQAELLHHLDKKVKELDPNWPIVPLSGLKQKKKETKQPAANQPLELSASDSAEVLRQKLLQDRVEKATRLREQKLLEEKAKVEQLLASQERKKDQQRREEERLKHELLLKKQQQDREMLILEQQQEIEKLKSAKEDLLLANQASQACFSGNDQRDTRSLAPHNHESARAPWQQEQHHRRHPSAATHDHHSDLHGRRSRIPHHSDNGPDRDDMSARGPYRAPYKRQRNNVDHEEERSKLRRIPGYPGDRQETGLTYNTHGNRPTSRRLSMQERRQRIPADREMPRQMRMDQHEELMIQLERRLSSGALSQREHNELVKQIEMLYIIQQKRNIDRPSTAMRQGRIGPPRGGLQRGQGSRRGRWRTQRPPPQRKGKGDVPRRGHDGGVSQDWQDDYSREEHRLFARDDVRPPMSHESYRRNEPDEVSNWHRSRDTFIDDRAEGDMVERRPDVMPKEQDRREDASAPFNFELPEQRQQQHDGTVTNLLSHQENTLPTESGDGCAQANSMQQETKIVQSGDVRDAEATVDAALPVENEFVGVADLFSRLIQSGIIALPSSSQFSGGVADLQTNQTADRTSRDGGDGAEHKDETGDNDDLPDVEWNMESLRRCYPGAIDRLCRGVQCSSCGLRFPLHQENAYGEHLDWHFRVNRRDTDSRRPSSRSWLLEANDWLGSNELVAIDEQGGPSGDTETVPVASDNNRSCAIDLTTEDDDICDICFEPFEQYWDEALEEWRYKEAVRIDGRTYHEQCYQDVQMEEQLVDDGTPPDAKTFSVAETSVGRLSDVLREDVVVKRASELAGDADDDDDDKFSASDIKTEDTD